jgi:hypothetical protein
MEMTTSWRHLFSAVLTLGASEGSVYERLRIAYSGALSKISPESGLPAHLRGNYQELMGELADLFTETGNADSKRASHLAKRVVALYDGVAKELR